MLTVWPSGSLCPNSLLAVVGPSTVTSATFFSSAAVRNRPSASVRARTSASSGVVPTTLVVQLAVPAVRVCPVIEIGATAAMSGAAVLDASAPASCRVSVVAEPSGPFTPPELVALPGVMISRLVPSALIWARICAEAPSPNPTVRITAAIPIRMPSMVSAERSRCERTASSPVRSVSRQFTGPHRHAPRAVSSDTRPSSRRTVRCGPAGDVGLVGDHHDRAAGAVQLVEQAEDLGGRGRVEVAGRLVGEQQVRLGDQRPGDRDPLLLAAGELARPVLGPVAEADPVQRGERPARAAPPGRRRRR